MPLSPPGPAAADSVEPYLAGWKAVDRLVHLGQSWSGHERNCVFLNTRGPRFANLSAASGLDFYDDGRALALVDWDHDGDLDLWLANRTGPRLRLMRNQTAETATQHQFVAFKLEGATCNRDAVGARVEVLVKGQPKLIQTLYAGDAFVSQSSKWLHFGLGRDAQIEAVTVRWPGGQAEAFSQIRPARFYLLKQGAGVASAWQPPQRTVKLTPSTPEPPKPTDTARVLLSDPYPMPVLTFKELTDTPALQKTTPTGPLLINLWASWCQPCVGELKAFAAQERLLRENGVSILALSVDGLGEAKATTPADARRLLASLKFPFPVGQATAEWLEKIEILGDRLFERRLALVVPTSFLLDRNGDLGVIYRGPVEVDTVLRDAALLRTQPAGRRDQAVPFAGRWYTKPGRILFERVASDFAERFPDEAVRYLQVALRQSAESAQGANPAAQARAAKEQIKLKLDLARLLLRTGKPQEALEQVDQVLTLEPNHGEARALRTELTRVRAGP
ncbi:MAG: ASPIC/UnbV domain-containing protein [Verrucomicrobia bacterium]|nr:ASPIC/UnbV domain-containing protein [Verrucomicrobiota bacterium]